MENWPCTKWLLLRTEISRKRNQFVFSFGLFRLCSLLPFAFFLVKSLFFLPSSPPLSVFMRRWTVMELGRLIWLTLCHINEKDGAFLWEICPGQPKQPNQRFDWVTPQKWNLNLSAAMTDTGVLTVQPTAIKTGNKLQILSSILAAASASAASFASNQHFTLHYAFLWHLGKCAFFLGERLMRRLMSLLKFPAHFPHRIRRERAECRSTAVAKVLIKHDFWQQTSLSHWW